MNQTFKNSYKVKEKEMVSLSVYNVGYQRCEPNYQWGPGVRDHYLIHYIVSGKGYYVTNHKAFPLTSGDVFLIYPDTQVTYYADASDPWEYYWVGFSGSDAGLILESTDFSKESPIISSCSFGENVKNQLYHIYEARGNEFSNAVTMAGQLYITLSLFLTGASNHNKKHHQNLDYVQKGITYMESHFSYPITIDDVATYVGISRSHLFREFKSHLGKSPKEYLSELRIKYSCTLLKNTDLSIGAIAASVGYDNGLYYSKVFRSMKGMPPSKYRILHS